MSQNHRRTLSLFLLCFGFLNGSCVRKTAGGDSLSSPDASTSGLPQSGASNSTEVTLGRAPFIVKATLTTPVGAGPFSAAVLIHGSGPQDRDATVGPNKPFKDIAEGLAARGIAVLRYDKRTFRYAAQLGTDVSIDTEVVLDAIDAVAFLKKQPNVESGRVFVVGHSLGALLAPEIGVRSSPVAGTVLLAPPGRAPWDSVLMQMRYLNAPAAQISQVEQVFVQLQAGKLRDDEVVLGAPVSYWKDWAARDGVAMTKKLQKPTLILHGDRDYQVTVDDIATWKNGLVDADSVKFMTLSGLNHLFFAGTGKPGPSEYEVATPVAETVLDAIADFVRSH
jgi:uncharacterized protein